MNEAPVPRVTFTPDALRVDWGQGRTSEYASVWLCDNLPDHRDAHSGQRLIDVTELPREPKIRSAVAREGTLLVEWLGEPGSGAFDLDWLARHAAGSEPERPELKIRRWLAGAALDARRDFFWRGLSEIRAEAKARAAWLLRLLQDGMAFIQEVPAEPGAILDAVALIGRIAETNYGLVFDVRSVPEPENLAYSDRGLGLHTDNPYREPVPGFQALHVLTASRDGGESLFADGFALAEQLRTSDPESFAVLTEVAVPFLYQSKDVDLYAERPLLRLDCRGEVVAVHYNNRSIAPLTLPVAATRRFYRAYRHWAELLGDPRFQLRLALQDGDLVVFDNQRILHGRTAFRSARFPRHLRGCYLTRDSVYSEAALLRRSLEPKEQ